MNSTADSDKKASGRSYDQDPYGAIAAKSEAQKLAFAPMVFHAAKTMRDLGILEALDKAGASGLELSEVATATGVSEYGVGVLLDMGLSAYIVIHREGRYVLAQLGYYVLHDRMTRVNMNFTSDVCYRAVQHLTDAIREGRPAGLHEFGDWSTVYQGLSQLAEPARSSWFAFDHFYSDRAFPELLERVFVDQPAQLFDIGGNTGRWALACCRYNPDVQVTLIDLPPQLEQARSNAEEAGFSSRVHTHALDLLEPDSTLPTGADVWWMSQFLDCFSPVEILRILRKVRAAMKPGAIVYILEFFWDRQFHEAAAYSLNAISLYFTCVANGNSRFYHSRDFIGLIEEAGFVVADQADELGMGHTLLTLRCA